MTKIKTPKFWTVKAWAEHMLHISGFTDIKEVKSVQSNNRGKVPRKSNKFKQSSKVTV
jgi:hypothetical protein